MNQYYFNKQNKAQWLTVDAPVRFLSMMNLFTSRVIGAIGLYNMHKAKGYNLEGAVKE